MNKIEFSADKGRQVEIDIAKFFAILFMILNHCLMVSESFENSISMPMDKVIGHLLGCPFSAPVFMFSMGMGIIYSRNSNPRKMVKRGIKLILLGILVNVGEFLLPHYLSGYLIGEWDVFPIAGGLLLFCIDILAFAGLSFICMGVMKKLKLSNAIMLIIAIVLSITGSFLRFIDTGSDIINLISGYFFGSTGGFTAFPLFNWLIIVVAGYVYGQKYIQVSNKKNFFKMWPLYLIISIAYFIGSWYIPGGFLTDARHYYFMTTLDVIFCLIYIHGNLGFCFMLAHVLPKKVNNMIVRICRNINVIYIVQWFIIPITYIMIKFFYKNTIFGDLSVIVITFVETIMSILIAEVIAKILSIYRRN